MPVIGHAFVGLGTAVLTHPADRAPAAAPSPRVALWVPALVVAAYLPDLVSQATLVTGWADARALGHSVFFAVLASAVLGPLLSRMVGDSPIRGIAIVLGSVLGHDLLDILQASDRMPFWPLSHRVMGPAQQVIPDGMIAEGVLFGAALAAAVGFRWALTGGNPLHLIDDPRAAPAYRLRLRMGWFVAGLFCMAVVGLNLVKRTREKQISEAFRLVEHGHYDEGLALLEQAQRWPGRPKPGRADYLMAEAAKGAGDRERAEAHYLRSYAADPSYFWLVGDLAVFYAEGHEPAAERRRKAAPYIERLRTDFAGQRNLPAVLARIERKLSQGSGVTEHDAHNER